MDANSFRRSKTLTPAFYKLFPGNLAMLSCDLEKLRTILPTAQTPAKVKHKRFIKTNRTMFSTFIAIT